MDFHQLLRVRRSVRKYARRRVSDAVLDRLLRMMQDAPSSGNLQSYEVLVVRRPATKRRLMEVTKRQKWVGAAPVLLVFFSDAARCSLKYGYRGAHVLCQLDAALAAAYFQLAAANEGLGTCWSSAFYPDKVCDIVKAPSHLFPVALISLGYPDEKPKRFPRRSLAAVVTRERF